MIVHFILIARYFLTWFDPDKKSTNVEDAALGREPRPHQVRQRRSCHAEVQ